MDGPVGGSWGRGAAEPRDLEKTRWNAWRKLVYQQEANVMSGVQVSSPGMSVGWASLTSWDAWTVPGTSIDAA